MLRLAIKTDNAAFGDGFKEVEELARILRRVAERIEDGDTGGNCVDGNGNTVGTFSLSEPPLHAQAGALREALHGLNWMSNYERDGFCCCPRGDGHVPDKEHSTACADARRALLATTKGA